MTMSHHPRFYANHLKVYLANCRVMIQDFIDAYFKEMKRDPNFDRWDLLGICLDFFEAGGETVGSTLSWLFMFMSLNQDAQERCYMELQTRLGNFIMHDMTTSCIYRQILFVRWTSSYSWRQMCTSIL